MRSVRKVPDLRVGEKKQAYMECWKPNQPPSSLLGTPHFSPSDATIVGNIPRKPLLEWCLALLSLQSEYTILSEIAFLSDYGVHEVRVTVCGVQHVL